MEVKEVKQYQYETVTRSGVRVRVSGVEVVERTPFEIEMEVEANRKEVERVPMTLPQQPSTVDSTPLNCGALWSKCRACATRAIGLRARGMRPQEQDIEDTASAIYSALFEFNAEGEVANMKSAWRKAIREGAREFERGRRLLSRSQDIDLCADGGLSALNPRAVMVSDKASALWAEVERVNALGIEGGHKIARVLGFHSAVELREALDVVCIGRRRASAPKVAHWSFDEEAWREAVAYAQGQDGETEDEGEDGQ